MLTLGCLHNIEYSKCHEVKVAKKKKRKAVCCHTHICCMAWVSSNTLSHLSPQSPLPLQISPKGIKFTPCCIKMLRIYSNIKEIIAINQLQCSTGSYLLASWSVHWAYSRVMHYHTIWHWSVSVFYFLLVFLKNLFQLILCLPVDLCNL